ncbi:MAG: 1-acyl-sn-glycerol-3-phosphate acyltransferase [Eubacterium sp.]|nr:1-acyl-sn-glycerol-3-phosphate acyltransferase [Eubacterium sp.]
MLRFLYVIVMNLFRAPFMITRMRYEADHPEKFSEKQRYELDQRAVRIMCHTGKIRTVCYGKENLPKEGGYIMYPNHQGKFDALAIILCHEAPCSVVMDIKKSKSILVREFIDLIQGKRLDKTDVRQAMKVIREVANEVKEGKRYILFPEGGYERNRKNQVGDFKPGSFKSATMSKAPIIPVALIDSFRVFNGMNVMPVTAQVHFLKPIAYEEYYGMKTQEIANLVKARIEDKIAEYTF